MSVRHSFLHIPSCCSLSSLRQASRITLSDWTESVLLPFPNWCLFFLMRIRCFPQFPLSGLLSVLPEFFDCPLVRQTSQAYRRSLSAHLRFPCPLPQVAIFPLPASLRSNMIDACPFSFCNLLVTLSDSPFSFTGYTWLSLVPRVIEIPLRVPSPLNMHPFSF